ncbi:hypothetical protein DSECCO2_424020 [anaerobic digester metagenome]
MQFAIPGIRGHVNRSSGNRHGALTSRHPVADLSPAAGCCPVEWLNRCRKIMGLRFQRNNGINLFNPEKIGTVRIYRCKLPDGRPLDKCYIILVR